MNWKKFCNLLALMVCAFALVAIGVEVIPPLIGAFWESQKKPERASSSADLTVQIHCDDGRSYVIPLENDPWDRTKKFTEEWMQHETMRWCYSPKRERKAVYSGGFGTEMPKPMNSDGTSDARPLTDWAHVERTRKRLNERDDLTCAQAMKEMWNTGVTAEATILRACVKEGLARPIPMWKIEPKGKR